jgi:hypothetical protein
VEVVREAVASGWWQEKNKEKREIRNDAELLVFTVETVMVGD